MPVQPRVSLITLGVSDIKRSRGFYESLGFVASPASQESVTFLKAGGVSICLYGLADLARDAHVEKGNGGFSGITLACNVRSPAEVDEFLQQAIASGATLKKPAQKVFWGGYSGYFADPDGFLWEVAFNPFWTFAADGSVVLP